MLDQQVFLPISFFPPRLIVDAAGRVPIKQTAFEKRVAKATRSGVMAARLAELTRKQGLPLTEKISLSLRIIQDWYEAWDGNVSVAYSGGKDSSVLLWLVRQRYPEVPAVFCHTGLEYPEVVHTVLDTPNHVVLRPEMHFGAVVKKYGWPIASKKIARGVNIVRHPTGNNENVRRLYLEGINRHGHKVHGFKVPLQWRFLFDAPFECSDKCCEIMKKRPEAKYERETGRKPFLGTLASDSKARQRAYLLEGGCNAFDMKRPRSAPLSFWTEQDVLRCILEYHIPIPRVYGAIVTGKDGELITTGTRRTGCVFCCFGLHMDEGRYNRFERLSMTHPRLHAYVMERLGLRDILTWCRANAVPSLARTFRWKVEQYPRPLFLLSELARLKSCVA